MRATMQPSGRRYDLSRVASINPRRREIISHYGTVDQFPIPNALSRRRGIALDSTRLRAMPSDAVPLIAREREEESTRWRRRFNVEISAAIISPSLEAPSGWIALPGQASVIRFNEL